MKSHKERAQGGMKREQMDFVDLYLQRMKDGENGCSGVYMMTGSVLVRKNLFSNYPLYCRAAASVYSYRPCRHGN